MACRQSIFDLFHPAIALLYCGVALVFSMAVMQPVYLALTFAGQLAFSFVLQGSRAPRGLMWQAPLVLVLAVANPLFVSVGSTELFRIGLHAVYAEALAFGLCQGLMLVNVLLTFSNAARVISSDKVMAVLGNVAPVVSLMISMTMRLVPQFARRGRVIASVQSTCTAANPTASAPSAGKVTNAASRSAHPAAIPFAAAQAACSAAKAAVASQPVCKAVDSAESAQDSEAPAGPSATHATPKPARKQTLAAKAASRLRMTTVLMGWGLEDSIETADAMRARGWGAVRKRTSYQRYRFRRADAAACAILTALTLSAALAAHAALGTFAFYPRITGLAPWYSYLPYAAFLALPLAAEAKERLSWR
jgi:energy-coupling factor transport system permease protein